jgi:hypothetical protein
VVEEVVGRDGGRDLSELGKDAGLLVGVVARVETLEEG